MNQKAYGFTIVELLIVIVVIAILAAISIVSYNGIQQRTANTKTEQAVAQWVKILNLYKSEQGAYPALQSCLGVASDYDATLGCRQDVVGGGIIRPEPTFYNAIQDSAGRASSYPSPTIIRSGSGVPYYIGAYWLPGVSPQRLDYVLKGTDSTCGTIGGARFLSTSTDAATGTRICRIAPES